MYISFIEIEYFIRLLNNLKEKIKSKTIHSKSSIEC